MQVLWEGSRAGVLCAAFALGLGLVLLAARRPFSAWPFLVACGTFLYHGWHFSGDLRIGAALFAVVAVAVRMPVRWLAGRSLLFPILGASVGGLLAGGDAASAFSRDSWPGVSVLDRWMSSDRIHVTRGGLVLRGPERRARVVDWQGPFRLDVPRGAGPAVEHVLIDGAGRDARWEVLSGDGEFSARPLNGLRLTARFPSGGGSLVFRSHPPSRPLRVIALAGLRGALGGLEELLASEPAPDAVVLLGDMAGEAGPFDVLRLRRLLDGAGAAVFALPGCAESGAAGAAFDAFLAGRRPVARRGSYGELRVYLVDALEPVNEARLAVLNSTASLWRMLGDAVLCINRTLPSGEGEAWVDRIREAAGAGLVLAPAPDGSAGVDRREGVWYASPGRSGDGFAAVEFTWPLEDVPSAVRLRPLPRKDSSWLLRFRGCMDFVEEQAGRLSSWPVLLGMAAGSLGALRLRRRSPTERSRRNGSKES